MTWELAFLVVGGLVAGVVNTMAGGGSIVGSQLMKNRLSSAQLKRVIGVLLVVAGAGYAFDTFSSVLSQNPMVVSTVTFLGELVLAVWLVARGGRVRVAADHEL